MNHHIRVGGVGFRRLRMESKSAAPAPHINLGEADSLRSRDPETHPENPAVRPTISLIVQINKHQGHHIAAFSPPIRGRDRVKCPGTRGSTSITAKLISRKDLFAFIQKSKQFSIRFRILSLIYQEIFIFKQSPHHLFPRRIITNRTQPDQFLFIQRIINFFQFRISLPLRRWIIERVLWVRYLRLMLRTSLRNPPPVPG